MDASEQDFQLSVILDQLPAIVSFLDTKLRMVKLSHGYTEIFGKSVQWAIGRHLSEVAGEPHFSIARPWLDRALAGERVCFESQVRQHDGQLRDVSVHYMPQFRDGAVIGIVAMVLDVTERRRAERALRESEERLRIATSAGRLGLFERDLRTGAFTTSAQCRVNAGFSPIEEITFDQLCARTQEDDLERVSAIVNQAVAEGRPYDYEYRIRLPDGSIRWIQTYGQPVYDESRSPVRVVGVTRDITGRKQLEEQLRRALLHLRFCMDAGHMADARFDLRTGIVHMSDSGRHLFGIAPGREVRLTDLTCRMHPHDVATMQQAMDQALASGADFEYEFRVQRSRGGWRWIQARGRPVTDESGQVAELVGIVQDVTARREVEESLREANGELQQANEDLRQFAYSASHDLREPLRMISTYGQLVERRYAESLDADGRRFIGFMVEGVQRMEALMNDLLEYTRAATLENPVRSAQCDGGSVLGAVLRNLQVAISDAGARIEFDALPDDLPIHEMHLSQILQNLIANALKYRRRDAQILIRISAERHGTEWQFRVADNGIGMEPKYTGQIFGLFRRLHRPEEYPGTGIGLAICQKIVQRYGGRIWAESPGPGLGSTFCFTVAAVPAGFDARRPGIGHSTGAD